MGTPDVRVQALTPLEQEILAFERRCARQWPGSGLSQRKQQAILAQFDVTPTRYFQLLNQLLDKPAAAQDSPRLVNLLREVRAARRKARADSNGILRGVPAA